MLVVDQLKKNDAQLRLLAVVIGCCLLVLLAGLWWVQVVKARAFRSSSETQSYRTVRLQSVRGKILDRNGEVLAENRATYNICVYLEELSPAFGSAFRQLRPVAVKTNQLAFWQRWLGFKPVSTNVVEFTPAQKSEFNWNCRYHVVSQIISQLAGTLGAPTLRLNTNDFKNHYASRRALPFPVLRDATPTQIARFSEQLTGKIAADLEIQSTRVYPHRTASAHVLGYVQRESVPSDEEEREYYHRLQDFLGVVGIEGYFDSDLRGRAGGKAVLVNHLGYRQGEKVLESTVPGKNVALTLDLRVQQAAEHSLRTRLGPSGKSAVVVMDVHSGDVLALVSSPASDPNYFINGFPTNEIPRWKDPLLGMQKNKATQEIYQPGSIFKTIIGLAALESGLNPLEKLQTEPNPRNSAHGFIMVGNRPIEDTAPPDDYDFRRAIFKSSNAYFVHHGLRPGVLEKIILLGEKLHLNERAGLPTRQDVAGDFPTRRRIASNWPAGETANLCLGQGLIAITPLQMTVMTAALANGGKVLEARLVDRLESQDPASLEAPRVFDKGQLRDKLPVQKKNFELLHEAMLADTETVGATAFGAFQSRTQQTGAARVMRVCGKTGTAQDKDVHGRAGDKTTWFISFAPYEHPRYAVVVMVEDGGSGGGTCAPIAADVYTALDKIEAGAIHGTLVKSP